MVFRLQSAGAGVLALAVLVGGSVAGQEGGLYTSEQAERGQSLYDAQCASCHAELRSFTPGMAALLGDHTFRASWSGRPIGELFGLIRETMPQDNPGSLSADQAADLVAYILSGNRLPAGETALSSDLDSLMAIPFEP